jgi:hypothetical protein
VNEPIRVEGIVAPNGKSWTAFDIPPVIAPDGSIDEPATFRRAVGRFMGTGNDGILRLNFITPGLNISGRWWWKGSNWSQNERD